MSIRIVDVGDREYGMQKAISGRLVAQASFDIINTVSKELMHEWERAKTEYGFPDDAVPEWRISWYYIQKESQS
jgi:hypothetical protein